jgi:hypothetical protein
VYLLDTTEKRTLENSFAQSQKMQAVASLQAVSLTTLTMCCPPS